MRRRLQMDGEGRLGLQSLAAFPRLGVYAYFSFSGGFQYNRTILISRLYF